MSEIKIYTTTPIVEGSKGWGLAAPLIVHSVPYEVVVDLPETMKRLKGRGNPNDAAIAVTAGGYELKTLIDVAIWIRQVGLELL